MSPWELLEEHVVHVTGGVLTPASGRLSRKGDIWAGRLLIECKQRTFPYRDGKVAVQRDWFDTTQTHAWEVERVPVVVFGPTFTDAPDEFESYYFCMEGDSENFDRETNQRSLTSVPKGWCLVTERSVGLYARKTAQDFPQPTGVPRTLGNKPSGRKNFGRGQLTSRGSFGRGSGFMRKNRGT